MMILNFSHPITPSQSSQLASLLGEAVTVRDVRTQFDATAAFAPQVAALLDGLGALPPEFIVNPPAMAAISLLVMDALRRGGALRPFIRLRTVPGAAVTTFEVAEVIGWRPQPPPPAPAEPPAGDTPRTSPAMPPDYRAWVAAPQIPYAPTTASAEDWAWAASADPTPAPAPATETPAAPAAPAAPAPTPAPVPPPPAPAAPSGAPSFPQQAENIEAYLAACRGGGLIPKYRPTEAEWMRLDEMAQALIAPRYNHAKAQIKFALEGFAKARVLAARPPFAERVAADNRTRFAAPGSERMAIREWSSTNGRWGLILTAHPRYAGELKHAGGRNIPKTVCIPGHATPRPNKVQGMDVVRVDESKTTWVYANEVRASSPMRGARIVYMEGLQSDRYVSVVETPEGGCWQEFGYKGRSNWWMTMRNGEAVGMDSDEIMVLAGENHAR